jgi:hypothetical protein
VAAAGLAPTSFMRKNCFAAAGTPVRSLHGKHSAGWIEEKTVSRAVREEFHARLGLALVGFEDQRQLP